MAQTATKFIWEPDAATLERANVVRLMRKHGFDDYWELVRRSQEDPEWFWPAAIEDKATKTTVLSSMIMNSPKATAPSVHHFRFSSANMRARKLSPPQVVSAH